jgi:hypothetical protein
VATSGRGALRIAVRISPEVWREEVERFEVRSRPREAAERERPALEQDGVRLADLERCAEHGPDGTRLGGLVKVYVPISHAPPSQRPFGFVLSPGSSQQGPYLALVAFGRASPTTGRAQRLRACAQAASRSLPRPVAAREHPAAVLDPSV